MTIDGNLLVFFGSIRVAPLTAFLAALAIGAVIAAFITMNRLKPLHGERLSGVWVMLLASIVLGAVAAKLVYVFSTFSFDRLTDFADPSAFSVWGGVLGVIAAVALTSGCCRVKPVQALDAFAPAGALMLAITRAGEFFLSPNDYTTFFGRIGISSDLLENAWHICFLESGIALVAALLAVTRFARHCTMMRTLYFTMGFQLITEMLHDQPIMIAGNVFIRVEQILCAIVMFVLLFQHARRGLSTNGHARFAPCMRFFIPVAIVIYAEFELDKCWINNLLWDTFANPETYELTGLANVLYTHHAWIWYGVILLCVIWMLILEAKLIKRRADCR